MKPKYTIECIYIRDNGSEFPDYVNVNLNGMSTMRVEIKIPEKGKKALLDLINIHIEQKINDFVLESMKSEK